MKLKQINLVNVPGVTGLPALQFGPGINVVIGPNNAGKSTIGQLISQSLWRKGAKVRGVASLVWHPTVDGASPISYQLSPFNPDGVPVPQTTISPDSQGCYHLRVGDLIRDSKADQILVKKLLMEMSGGLDLDGQLTSLKKLGTTAKIAQKNLREAETELQRIEKSQADLAQEEDQLDELRQQKESAVAAGGLLTLLESRRVELEQREIEAEATRALAQFAPAMARLKGTEADDATKLRGDLQTKSEGKNNAVLKRKSIEASLESLGLGVDSLDPEIVDLLDGCQSTLDGILDRIAQAKEELVSLRCGKQILGELDLDEIEALAVPEPEELHRFVQLMEERARCSLSVEELQDQLDRLPDVEIDASSDDLHEARGILAKWLQIPDPQDMALARQTMIAGLMVAIVSGLAIPSIGFWAQLGAALGLGALLAGLFMNRLAGSWGLDRQSRESDFEATGFERPATWSIADVSQKQKALDQAYADAKFGERIDKSREELTQRLQTGTKKQKQLQARAAQLAGTLGLELSNHSTIEYVAHLERIRILQETGVQIGKREGTVESLQEDLAQHQSRCKTVLAKLGKKSEADPDSLSDQLKSASTDCKSHKSLLENLSTTQLLEEGLENDVNKRLEDIEAIFSALDLETNDDAGLNRLLESREEYESHSARRNTAQVLAGAEAQRTQDHEDIVALDLSEVEEESNRTEAEAEQRESLTEQINEIEFQIRLADDSEDLRDAINELHQRADELAEIRVDHLERAIKARLVAQLAEKHRRESQPKILTRAQELFQRFTRRQWALELVGGDQFSARCVEDERPHDLMELSTGTRMQLLIAARLAFVESQEQGEKLPLFLDEVLSSSDPDRSSIMAEALAQIADEGRQIFYFTADPGDVATLRRAAEHAGSEFQVTDLAEARKATTSELWQEVPTEITAIEVPAIEGHDGAGYAKKINAPLPRSTDSENAIHLVHLLPDRLPLLRHLLLLQISNLGEWRQIDGDKVRLFVPDEADVRLIRARDRMHTSFLTQWRIGRGKPASSADLDRWGFLKLKAGSDMAGFLSENAGSMAHLLAAIESKEIKLNKPKTAELSELATHERFLDERPTLNELQIVASMASQLADLIDEKLIDLDDIRSHVQRMQSLFATRQQAAKVETESQGELGFESA